MARAQQRTSQVRRRPALSEEPQYGAIDWAVGNITGALVVIRLLDLELQLPLDPLPLWRGGILPLRTFAAGLMPVDMVIDGGQVVLEYPQAVQFNELFTLESGVNTFRDQFGSRMAAGQRGSLDVAQTWSPVVEEWLSQSVKFGLPEGYESMIITTDPEFRPTWEYFVPPTISYNGTNMTLDFASPVPPGQGVCMPGVFSGMKTSNGQPMLGGEWFVPS